MSDQEESIDGRGISSEMAEKEEQAAATPQDSPEPPSYPRPLIFAINMVAMYIAVFCVALDNTIISTAIPKITDQFNALNDVGWYGSGK